MTEEDFDRVLELWTVTEGVGLSEADSRESIGRFLLRNPALSQVAFANLVLVGAVLCGDDGRRGYIHHLTVRPSHRRQGIGTLLVKRCLEALKAKGIDKCHLFVFSDNLDGITFWESAGWHRRIELTMMSHYTG